MQKVKKAKRFRLICFVLLYAPMLTYALEMNHMRGIRYCEIIFSHGLSGYVYNTINLNHCPSQIWDKITPSMIKKETGSYFVYLNGPRYTVMDGARNTEFLSTERKTLGGLSMRHAGTIHLNFLDLIKNSTPYSEHQVDRKSTWVYQANKPVFELIDPKGRVFVMQSYSNEVVKQSEDQLSHLGSRLTLPKGWRFRTGILKHDDYVVAVNNQAVVVQDNFKNTYQLATNDFLKN